MGDEWTNLSQDKRDELIKKNRCQGGRGKKRQVVTSFEAVNLVDKLGLNKDIPFLNFRQFAKVVQILGSCQTS